MYTGVLINDLNGRINIIGTAKGGAGSRCKSAFMVMYQKILQSKVNLQQ
jgi:hypothetical protein